MEKFFKFEKLGFILILLVLFLNLGFLFSVNKNYYTKKYNPTRFESIYKNSQFAKNPENRRFIIEDWDLFALAGYHYIHGGNPADINFEHPPLAKYFFGLSILIFNNPNVIQIFFSLGLLGLIFLIGKEILKSNFLAMIPPTILSFDQIFQQQSRLSMLDLPQVFFVTLSFFIFAKTLSDKRFYLLLGIILGVIFAIKYMAVAIFAVYFIYLLFKKRDDLKFYFGSVLIAIVVYFATWIAFFTNGHNLTDFVKLNIDIVRLYRSYLPEYPKGEIWRLLTTGNWRVWFGNIPFVHVGEYWWFWPVSFISLIAVTYFARKLNNLFLTLVLLWSWFYLISSSLHVIFPRHLLLFLPFGSIFIVYFAKEVLTMLVSAGCLARLKSSQWRSSDIISDRNK